MEKKSTISIIKIIFGAIVFLILLSVLLTFLGKVFLPHEHITDQQQQRYYFFPENTVDVLIDGNSTLRQGISPNYLWHDYGIVAYSRVDGHQCPEMSYFEVKETLNRHKIKLVIMCVPRAIKEYDYVLDEPLLRRNLDYRRLSLDKIKIAAAISSHTDILTTISYIFPLLRYHSRWTDLTYEESIQSFERERDFWRGQFRARTFRSYKPRKLTETSREVPEFNQDAIKWYKKTFELCKENDVQVLLVSMPEIEYTMGMHIGLQKFADSCGLDYLDFNTEELSQAIDLNYEEDFQNPRHVNILAANKITKYLGEYITENYGVPQWECSDETKKILDEDFAKCEREYKKSYKKLEEQKKKK